ncbi:N-lysine methyltransferase setd6 [Grifola frondosa]|uniref:N-lysine methyltransferase setd6 n=1 Tax=Grifola frondosa TaxID=5627 RepID=A0A1C7M2X1_GRIFR|nr:N-lysine methyltransferase setd6 [Grifola frondosa]
MSEPHADFISWFHSQNGVVDTTSVGLTYFPGHGRGAIALQDIPEGHTLFSIPRQLTLSTRTSALPRLLGEKCWTQFGLGNGWVGLILCMMWEESRGSTSPWYGYLACLPTTFDTPMFWSEEELQELQGTAVVEKIGKKEAEQDYYEKLIPAIQSRPDLFPANSSQYYSLERYHLMGSRILSRSFNVEQWKGEESEDNEDEHANANASDLMDVDGEQEPEATIEGPPVLNWTLGITRFESENAKLFHEEHHLKMLSTKPIKAGEQIGNPEDVVELRADLVVAIASQSTKVDVQERVEWWLEIADDDAFVMGTDCELPEELISFLRLLFLSHEEWEKTRSKSKLPKAKVDARAGDGS